MFQVILSANLIVRPLSQIKTGMIKHVDTNVEIIVHSKKIVDLIQAHVFVRMIST